MSQVDFYVLSQGGDQARQVFACRLAEKAWRLKNNVHILTASRADAEHLDTLLWTFRDGSFVPHEIVGPGEPAAPVTIGFEAADGMQCDLLINLSDELPPAVDSLPRVAELVSPDPEGKRLSRKRFAAYRDQGHEISTHKL